MEDDFPDSIFTTGNLSAGIPAFGEIEQDFDEDWFRVELVQGREYRVEVRGSATSDGTLSDPVFAGVYNALGEFVEGFDDDDGIGLNASYTFIAGGSGTHYFAAAPASFESGTDIGSYTIEYFDLSPIDPPIDPPNEQVIPLDAELNEGDDISYTIDLLLPTGIAPPFPGTGVPGELITEVFISDLSLAGSATVNEDYTVFAGFNDDFDALILNLAALPDDIVEDDENAIVRFSGYVDWIVPTSSTEATIPNILGGFATGAVERLNFSVSLEVNINSAPEGNPIPIDDFTFFEPGIITNVLETFLDGSEEEFSVVPFSFSSELVEGQLLANGDLVLTESSAPPGQTIGVQFIVEDGRGALTDSEQVINFGALSDDFLPGETATELGSIVVGSTAVGSVEATGDRDRFEVFLEAGQRYEIALSTATTSSGTLADPEIFGVFNSLNQLLPDSGDDDGGPINDALVELVVDAEGIYEIEVGSNTPFGTGGYELSVASLGAVDDFLPGDFAEVFGQAVVGIPTIGVIEETGDRDRFDVSLDAGVLYNISMEGFDTGGGSLVNPEIIGVFNSLGQAVAGGADNNSGTGANAFVEGFTVDADGVYQIEVASARDINAGDYTLIVESDGFIDDFLPGISGGFGEVAIGGRTDGEIETAGDIDGFRVTLQSDTTYQINILGNESNTGTLHDPDLVGIFSSGDLSGTPISSVQTLNQQLVGDDSTSIFTPQSSGEFFIGVQDQFGGTGTYAVEVIDLGFRDDFAADIDTTGSITPGGNAVGRIDFNQDEDWFEVDLAANRLYEIELVPVEGVNALADPFFRGVYDSDGVLIQNTENDDGGSGRSSSLQFVTDEPGTFYLAAGGFGDATGQYRLELNDLGPLDDSSFDITIEFISDDVPDEYVDAFEEAVERWEQVIVGDLDYGFVEGYGFVDDILIEVSVEDIELVFAGVEQNILAISSVLDQRSDALTGTGALPTYSRIVLNSEEIGTLLNLDELAQNTIGRALGFGSLWEEFGLVRDIDGIATYTGSNALREMEELSDDLNGQNVLEDGEDGALAAEYWSEANLDAELMTPRVELRRPENGLPPQGRPDNPISALTIGAMQDLGYDVDYGAADSFFLQSGALTRRAEVEEGPDQTLLPGAATPSQRLLSDVPDNDSIPNGTALIYVRPNALSESFSSFALNNSNSQLLAATGTNAVFIEAVTGDSLNVELKGTFTKNDPTTVNQLSGTVDSMDVYSLTGLLLFSVDYSQSPVPVGEVISQWPYYSMDDENVIIVDTLPETLARINPNGGGENANRIFAGANDDYVRGGDLAEFINGGSGNDTLEGQGGNDTIIGEGGTDTAMFSGNQASYTLTLSAETTSLQDRRGDESGTDRLINIELLDFDTNFGGADVFNVFDGATSLSAANFESFIELYIAYFNRAPDAVGLNFWGTAFANGTTFEQMATFFVDQDETRATYPSGTSNNEFATAVYNNVLGRTPDQEGIDFWVGALDSGQVSRDQFILEALRGAKSDLKPELGQDFVDQQLADRAYLENKIDIGAYFAVHRGMSDVGNATAAMALYNGSNSSINAAVNAIDGFYNAALNPNNGEFLMPVVGVLDNPFEA